MLLYLVNIVRTFLPLALVAGILLALWTPLIGRKAFRGLIISLVAGLLGGIIIYLISFRQETLTAARSSLVAVSALAATVNGGALLLPKNASARALAAGRSAAWLFLAALGAGASFSFLSIVTEQALSAITVLNTELILNIGGILAGACLIAFLIPLTARAGAKSGRGIVAGSLLLLSALLVVPWGAEVLLGLMRLEMAEVTSARLSFVAKTGKYAHAVPYALLSMLAVLSLAAFAKRKAILSDDLFTKQRAQRRKARSRILLDWRWFKAALASVCAIFAVLLYHDLYASRPPKISPPVNLTPDASGLIKVRTSEVADGKLHRYSYVTDDGHVVRFFMINRSKGQNRIGVVYDACMLCGDMGYIQEKNEVICIACNVRIFIPSIGKAGGCNPIPLAHAVEGEYIVVSADELDKGARYFSEVVSRKVKDPVSGKELSTLKAPYRSEYKGRTYFFESEETEEKFKESPEKYIGEQQSRYFRVQGYREM
jgi:uncharacterized membrane protein/YHS domain-containing protein